MRFFDRVDEYFGTSPTSTWQQAAGVAVVIGGLQLAHVGWLTWAGVAWSAGIITALVASGVALYWAYRGARAVGFTVPLLVIALLLLLIFLRL